VDGMMEEQQQQQVVEVQAVPMSWSIGQSPDGKVVVQVATPVGTSVYFLERPFARQVADLIRQQASGLVIPTVLPTAMNPNGHGDGGQA
jgi:hypothetical protein